jgi:hypothetical protein
MKTVVTERTSMEATSAAAKKKVVYWHSELPPLDAEARDQHVIEAASLRVANKIENRDELWHRCYGDLMVNAQWRLEQEVARLGGDYAHVLDEVVDSRRDDRTGETWLHGIFTYMLYRN